MSLRDTPKHENVSHSQPSPRGEGGERSEPGEGFRPNFSGRDVDDAGEARAGRRGWLFGVVLYGLSVCRVSDLRSGLFPFYDLRLGCPVLSETRWRSARKVPEM